MIAFLFVLLRVFVPWAMVEKRIRMGITRATVMGYHWGDLGIICSLFPYGPTCGRRVLVRVTVQVYPRNVFVCV